MEKKELQEQIRQKEEEMPLTALIIAIINLVRK